MYQVPRGRNSPFTGTAGRYNVRPAHEGLYKPEMAPHRGGGVRYGRGAWPPVRKETEMGRSVSYDTRGDTKRVGVCSPVLPTTGYFSVSLNTFTFHAYTFTHPRPELK